MPSQLVEKMSSLFWPTKKKCNVFQSETNITQEKVRTKLASAKRAEHKFACLIRIILLHEKFLQFDWLRAVVFQLNLKYLHVKITILLRVVV